MAGNGDGTEHEHVTGIGESRRKTSEEEETVEGYILSFASFHLNGRPPEAVCERLLEAGWGTRVPYMKNSNVPLEEYSKLFDANGYYKFCIERPGEDRASAASGEHWPSMNSDLPTALLENEKKSAAHDSLEEKIPELAERTPFGSCEEIGEDGRSQVVESNILLGSCEEKIGGGDSQEVHALDEKMGEDDDDSVLFSPEDIRDSDSDSFYLEELHSSIDEMEDTFIDSEFEDDIFGQMEDDYLEESDCYDEVFGKVKVPDDLMPAADGGIVDDTLSAGSSCFQLNEPSEAFLCPQLKIIWEPQNQKSLFKTRVEYGIVRRWACANFSYLSHEESRDFLNRIVDMCVAVGMKFTRSPIKEAQAATTHIESTLLDLIKGGRKEEQLGILLVILPHNKFYDRVEEVCVNHEVTFYYCLAREAWCESKAHLRRIAHAIQSKVVMRDARRRRLALPLVSEAPILIFGADVVCCTPGDDNSDRIASVATSLDWPKFRRYICGRSHAEGSINVSDKLGCLISEFIYSFCKRGKGTVEKIIFFRNGLKDGQFGDICQEMSAIKKACVKFLGGYELHITYVVVLPHASMGMGNKSGTGVDLTGYKFWCRHSGGKKLSSLACYHVVHDENNFPPDELQALTSKLCGIRDRREYPEIDIVPPAYYAKRGGMMSLEKWERTKQLMKSQSN